MDYQHENEVRELIESAWDELFGDLVTVDLKDFDYVPVMLRSSDNRHRFEIRSVVATGYVQQRIQCTYQVSKV